MPAGNTLKAIILAVAVGTAPAVTLGAESVATNAPAAPTPSIGAVESAYGRLPLSFEVNLGQVDSRVQFLSRGRGYSLFLTSDAALLALTKASGSESADLPASIESTNNPPRAAAALRMKLVGADPRAKITGLDELPGKSNYLVGNDPSKWHTNVPNYARVKFDNVYPGVDLLYYGNQGQLEYDFVVQPGASVDQIELQIAASGSPDVAASEKLRIDHSGDLVVPTDGGAVGFHRPVVYQLDANGRRHSVEGQYVLRAADRVAFQLGRYDHRLAVVIDPVLSYSTYLGGNKNADYGYSIAADAAGNAYITGSTEAVDGPDFPTTSGAFQTTQPSTTQYARVNAFVSKLNPSGSALIYSTYLGGSEGDGGRGIAIDATGNAYVVGATLSNDFPTTPGAFRTVRPGVFSSFVSKLNASGSALIYSTFWADGATAIAVDATGNAYVSGSTESQDLPTTPGAFQTTATGLVAFVSKLNAAGSALIYSTYLGNHQTEGHGLAIDTAGNPYVAGITYDQHFPTTPGALHPIFHPGGFEGFVTKLNAAGSALVYSTFMGPGAVVLNTIAVDASDNAYVAGRSQGGGVLTTPGALQPDYAGGPYDAILAKLNPSGSALIYCTYLGGNSDDIANAIAVDSAGNASVTGGTGSQDFPTTSGAFQTFLRPQGDAFVSQLNATGSGLLYSTFLGGKDIESGTAIALDSAGNIYATGYSFSADFPTTPGALKTQTAVGGVDAFLAKIATNVPFATFKAKADIDLRQPPHCDDFAKGHGPPHENKCQDEFEMTAAVTLGADSNGIAPRTEPVTVQLGTFSTTIPAGSFKKLGNGRFSFLGVIDGVKLDAVLNPLNLEDSYEFELEGKGVDLTGTKNPVMVSLTIGDDSGSKKITAQFGPLQKEKPKPRSWCCGEYFNGSTRKEDQEVVGVAQTHSRPR